MIQIGIQSDILQQIIDGRKTIEGRLGKEKFLTISPGDVVSIREDRYKDGTVVSSIEDRLNIKIDTVSRFDSFEQMLEAVGFQNAIPSAKSLDEAACQYRTYYSKEDEATYGVVAFGFHVVSN